MKRFYILFFTFFATYFAQAQNPFGVHDSIVVLPCSDGNPGIAYIFIDSPGSYNVNNEQVYAGVVFEDIYFGENVFVIENILTSVLDTFTINTNAYQTLHALYINNDSTFCHSDYFNPVKILLDVNYTLFSTYSIFDLNILGGSNGGYLPNKYFDADTAFVSLNSYPADTAVRYLLVQAANNSVNSCLLKDTIAFYPLPTPEFTISQNILSNNTSGSQFSINDGISFVLTYCGKSFFDFHVNSVDSVLGAEYLDTMLYVSDFINNTFYFGVINTTTGCYSGSLGFEAIPWRYEIRLMEDAPILFPINTSTSNYSIDSTTIRFAIKNGYTCDATESDYTCGIAASIKDITDGISLENVQVKVYENYKPFTQNGSLLLSRYFEITPDVQGAADITLYFVQDHFKQYNDSALAQGLPIILADTLLGYQAINITKITGGLYGSGGASNNIPALALWQNDRHCWAVTFPVTSFSGFYIGRSLGPVGIETMLSGKVINHQNTLQWVNAGAIKVQKINVEYSTDALTWQTCAANINAKIGAATYMHATELPRVFYRLVSFSEQGTYNYSNTVLLTKGYENAVHISPNPMTHQLDIQYNSTEKSNIEISIMDITGKMIIRKNVSAEMGHQKIQIPVSELNNGLYTLMISKNNEIVLREKVLKK
jgi:Secretion system C-terminal sorting domain